MITMSAIPTRSCDALVDALEAEFGCILADRIVEAEAVDFLWEARVSERYLGEHTDLIFGEVGRGGELSRMLVLSSLAGRWHVGTCLVNGEGDAIELIWQRRFATFDEAETAYLGAH